MQSVLHIVHGVFALEVGGLERLVLDLVRQAVRASHRVSVVCIEKPGQLAAEAEAAGATVISLGKPLGRHPGYRRGAEDHLRGLRPDVIHTHQIGVAWYLGPAAHALGVPVVHTEHGNHFARVGTVLSALKARLTFRSAALAIDRFCCVSEEIAVAVTRWRTVRRGTVQVVPNGIQLAPPGYDLPDPMAVRAALGIPPDAPVIGTVGRLAEVKRQDLLIRAVARIRAVYPEVHLVLVGDGPERGRLEAVAQETGLAGRTHFLGYQTRPEEFLRIMTVFALTSRSEGFPISLLEAWRAGVPVACAAVGGIPAVVAEGVTGILFRPGDEAAAAAGLAAVLRDPVRAAQLGAAGRDELRRKYSLERAAAEYEGIYRALIAPRPLEPTHDATR